MVLYILTLSFYFTVPTFLRDWILLNNVTVTAYTSITKIIYFFFSGKNLVYLLSKISYGDFDV